MSASRFAASHRVIVMGAAATLAAGTFVATNLAGAASGPSAVDYAQCANGIAESTSCDGGWINGILNASNSSYREDEATAQRLSVSFPDTDSNRTHSVTLKYLDRKGGIHAYDSLASYDVTETGAQRCDPSPFVCPTSPTDSTAVVADPTAVAPFSNSLSGMTNVTATHQLAGADAQLKLYGATFVTGNPQTTTGYPVNPNPPAMSTPVHDCTATSSCLTSGDDYATTTISFTTPSGPGPHVVQLLFGGHLAVGAQPDGSAAPRGWGPGNGASSVAGGPYHIKWAAADGSSVGNRDNQIMSSAIRQIVASGTTMGSTTTPAFGDVVVGSTSLATIRDQANLTVDNTAHAPSGYASFSLYGPFSSAPTATSCVDPDAANGITGTRIAGPFTGGTWAEEGLTAVYDSNMAAADYVNLPSTTGFAAGKYYQWVASYVPNGDLYNEASNSGCANAFERIHVTKVNATATSTQTVSDTVVVTGFGPPTGTVSWYLYPTLADCSAGTNAVDSDVAGSPVDTNNSLTQGTTTSSATSKGITVNAPAGGKTYFWKVTYSGDTNNATSDVNGVIEPCGTQTVNVQNAPIITP